MIMAWKRYKDEESETVIYYFLNEKIKGGATASFVNDPADPDAEIRILYGEESDRITIPVSKSKVKDIDEKEFLRIVNLHLKRHGVKIK